MLDEQSERAGSVSMNEIDEQVQGEAARDEAARDEAARDEVAKKDQAEKDEAAGTAAAKLMEEENNLESGFLSFPDRLMMLLDSGEEGDSLWWMEDGESFCIAPHRFSESVLEKYFQGTKFESFTRKLNRWSVYS